MKLSEIIEPEGIISELKAGDKKGVLEELAEAISNCEPAVDQTALVKVLLERERLGSTGIGDGVAIPHGKLSVLTTPKISFGRSKKGLDFDSMDDQPTHLFFLLVAPENSANTHLKALAKIAKVLRNTAFRKKLMDASSREDLYQVIIQTDEE